MNDTNTFGEIPAVAGSLKDFKVKTIRGFIRNEFPGNNVVLSPFDAESGVNPMPKSINETVQGAINRVQNSLKANRSANIAVAIEGGVCQLKNDGPYFVLEAAAIALNTDADNPLIGYGTSDLFELPTEFNKELKEGKLLHELVINFVHSKNGQQISEQDIKENGSAFYLSDGQVTREGASLDALNNAMAMLILQINN